jgi:hypothetical protein
MLCLVLLLPLLLSQKSNIDVIKTKIRPLPRPILYESYPTPKKMAKDEKHSSDVDSQPRHADEQKQEAAAGEGHASTSQNMIIGRGRSNESDPNTRVEGLAAAGSEYCTLMARKYAEAAREFAEACKNWKSKHPK